MAAPWSDEFWAFDELFVQVAKKLAAWAVSPQGYEPPSGEEYSGWVREAVKAIDDREVRKRVARFMRKTLKRAIFMALHRKEGDLDAN